LNTFATIYSCKFTNNVCGNHFTDQEIKKIKEENPRKWASSRKNEMEMSKLPKGGAAILIWSNQPENYWDFQSLFDTVTSKCCFAFNNIQSIKNPISFPSAQRGGHDVLIGPQGIMRSYDDSFLAEKDISISVSALDGTFINYNTKFKSGDKCDASKEVKPQTYESKDDPVDTVSIYTDKDTIQPVMTTEQEDPITAPPRETTEYLSPIPLNPITPYTVQTQSVVHIRSPTVSASNTPTCSTYGEKPGQPLRTYISTFFPPFPWNPEATPYPTQTKPGDVWPTQTASRIITQTPYGETPPPVPTRSWWGEIPNQTPTASISFEFEAPIPTQSDWTHATSLRFDSGEGSPSITGTFVLINTVTLSVTFSPSATLTLSVTETVIPTLEEMTSYSQTFDQGSETESIISTISLSMTHIVVPNLPVPVYHWIPGESFVYSSFSLYSYAEYVVFELPKATPKSENKVMLYVIIATVILVLAIIGVLIFIYVRRKKKDDEEEEEMKEETVSTIKSSTGNVTITQDNPLWNDNVINVNADDPFRSDFEEETNNIINSTATL